MKRFIAVAMFITVMISSCGMKNTQGAGQEKKITKIESFVESFFDRHQDGYINNLATERSNDDFYLEITDSLKNNQDFLSEIPIRFEGCREYSKGEYSAQFQSWIKAPGFVWNLPEIHEVCFDIMAKVSEEEALSLVEGEYYYISGNFVKFLSVNESTRYKSRSMYTNEICIKKDLLFDDEFNVYLGIMLYENVTIKPIK